MNLVARSILVKKVVPKHLLSHSNYNKSQAGLRISNLCTYYSMPQMDTQLIKPKNNSQGVELTFLTTNGTLVRRNGFIADFSFKYNNLTSEWIKNSVDAIWEEACRKNVRLYNRSKFRLFAISVANSGHLTFQLGLTSYKELIATNCHPFGRHLMEFAKQSFANDRSCLADVLGVGSLLRTADEKFLFIKRALWTGEDKGKLDRPGGHPEPENVSLKINLWSEEDCARGENRLKIRNEIFDSVLHEIRDEVNIPLETLTDPVLLGVVRSVERLGRPSAEFLVRCTLSSEQIRELYVQNSQPEADESQDILFIDEKDIRLKKLSSTIWSDLTDAACGAIELYSISFVSSSE